MKILTICLIGVILTALVVSFILMKKYVSPKYKETKVNLKCTIFTTIISPVLTLVSVILVVFTLQIQLKDSKQEYYNTEFSFLFNEMKSLINELSVEVKYNQYSSEPVTLEKLQVIDELAYYLKKDKSVRRLFVDNIPKDVKPLTGENAWFTAKNGDFYYEKDKCYKLEIRPDIECEYFEKINMQFRNIFKPIFDLLANHDNEHREMHMHLIASYLDINIFEAYLQTRWEKQDFPDEDVLNKLIQWSKY